MVRCVEDGVPRGVFCVVIHGIQEATILPNGQPASFLQLPNLSQTQVFPPPNSVFLRLGDTRPQQSLTRPDSNFNLVQ